MFSTWPVVFITLGIAQLVTEIGGLLSTPMDLPSVLVAIQIRNKAHILPYFFSYLSKQNYPKNRIGLQIRSDHNEDKSIEITQKWINKHREEYESVSFKHHRVPENYAGEKSSQIWPEERNKTLMALRDEALVHGIKKGFSYLLMIDADVLLANSSSLHELIHAQKPIIGPMIGSFDGYVNFEFKPHKSLKHNSATVTPETIEGREHKGIFPVSVIKHCVLIDLKNPKAKKLTYDLYRLPGVTLGSEEDALSLSAKEAGLRMFVDNRVEYGFMPPPLKPDEDGDDDEQRTLAAISYASGTEWDYAFEDIFEGDEILADWDDLEIQKVFVINLKRCPQKKDRMNKLLTALGWTPTFVQAIDGKQLDTEELRREGITPMPDYLDRYLKRKITLGEIGCMLSHHLIWKEMIQNGWERVLILEDDATFEPYGKRVIRRALMDLEEENISWDLLYVGRKPLQDNRPGFKERHITSYILKPGYSYWTIGYILTLEGARKLVNSPILDQVIPADEFLPIMSDVHPDLNLSARFPVRNLKTYAIAYRTIWPRFFIGDTPYETDTEEAKLYTPFSTDGDQIEEEDLEEMTKGDEREVLDFDSQHQSLIGASSYASSSRDEGFRQEEYLEAEIVSTIEKLLSTPGDTLGGSFGNNPSSGKIIHQEL